jgi:hypothetical protein
MSAAAPSSVLSTVLEAGNAFIATPSDETGTNFIGALRKGAILTDDPADRRMEHMYARNAHCLVINTEGAVHNEGSDYTPDPLINVPVSFNPEVKTLLDTIVAMSTIKIKDLRDLLKEAEYHTVYIATHPPRSDFWEHNAFVNAEATAMIAVLEARMTSA